MFRGVCKCTFRDFSFIKIRNIYDFFYQNKSAESHKRSFFPEAFIVRPIYSNDTSKRAWQCRKTRGRRGRLLLTTVASSRYSGPVTLLQPQELTLRPLSPRSRPQTTSSLVRSSRSEVCGWRRCRCPGGEHQTCCWSCRSPGRPTAPPVHSQSHRASLTDSQSHSASLSLTDSQSHSASLTNSQSHSASLTDSQSHCASLTDSQSKSASLSLTDSQSHSASLTDSQSHSASLTDSQSHSASLSLTDSQSHSASLTDSQSHSASLTDRQSHSALLTDRQSNSASFTDSQSHSASLTDSQSNSAALTDSQLQLLSQMTVNHNVCHIPAAIHTDSQSQRLNS